MAYGESAEKCALPCAAGQAGARSFCPVSMRSMAKPYDEYGSKTAKLSTSGQCGYKPVRFHWNDVPAAAIAAQS
ncbi:MAG: hypothetical protein ACLS3C_05045, partial [Oscillospiraceae bacterium]